MSDHNKTIRLPKRQE